MSRHGFGGSSEHHQQQREGRAYRDELPLPTYEEVVGTAGLKALFAGGAATSLGRVEGPAERSEVLYEPRFTSSRKSSILVLIGLILIPLCALIVFIQLKGCTVSHQSPSSISSEFLDGDNLDSLYSKCVDEKNNLLQLIHDFLGSSGPNKLLQNYKSTINNKEELEKSLENLRDQLKILHIKKEKLEWLLDNVNKTFTQLTYSDNTNVKNEDTSTGENTEVKSASSEQKSQTVREKSIQERINEWSKMPPDTAIKIETAIQKVKDFMESNDKT